MHYRLYPAALDLIREHERIQAAMEALRKLEG